MANAIVNELHIGDQATLTRGNGKILGRVIDIRRDGMGTEFLFRPAGSRQIVHVWSTSARCSFLTRVSGGDQ